jgi:arsenate reductase (thioredoxin)
MSQGHYNVLFLSNWSTARSIIAEAAMNRIGRGNFIGFSAGMHPADQIDALVVEVLGDAEYPTELLRSKHWTEFARDGVPALDFVFTLCNPRAGESLPHWPGRPATADWHYPKPNLSPQTWERRKELVGALRGLESHLLAFVQLPFEKLDQISLSERLRDMGQPLTNVAVQKS